MIIDSHCHLNRLDLDGFDQSLEKALAYAREQGVEHFLTVAVELEDADILAKLAKQYPDVSYSVGWHPCDVNDKDIIGFLCEKGQASKCVAIGETGLDYYHLENEDHKKTQHHLFSQHIEAEKAVRKPLIIHTRQSIDDTLDKLKSEHDGDVGGVMHCFTEDWASAKKALDLNFYISLSGIVTFKNAQLVHEVAKNTPLDRLLIETDSPYLAPHPFRGKSNHPAWVKYVAEMIANLRGISFEEVASNTTRNFYRLFQIHQGES
jgi:TatD DNase family protein